ncbi:MAG: phosphonate C-P lyase system protein PhnH [Gammaproteobacteria bacterium]
MSAALLSGFSDPTLQSQQVFRRVLEAMAHPGRIVEVGGVPAPPRGLSIATTAVCLTLLDFETPVWLAPDAEDAREYLGFHCHSPITQRPGAARFAVIPAGHTDLELGLFNAGSDEHPENSTTVILGVDRLANGPGEGALRLSGPGIETETVLNVEGLTRHVWNQVRANHDLFPRGLDFILTTGAQLAALPRTTRIEMARGAP